MRTKPLALAITAMLGGIASAQPGPMNQPIPPMDTGQPTTQDPLPPDPNTQQPQQNQVQAEPKQQVIQEEEEPATTDRPDGLAIAIGFGYGWAPGGTTSLQTPNRTSVRLRLAGGVQVEPTLRIENETEDIEAGTEATNKVTRFGLAALVRFPVVKRGKVDVEVLGGLGFQNEKDNPDQDYNTETTNTFSVGYGLALAYWISHHWNLSFSATNPLVSFDSTKRQLGPNMTSKTSTTDIGLTWLPSVFIMIHLYN